MPGPVFRTGERVELRTVEEEDLEFLQRLVNDPDVRPGLGSSDPVNGLEEQEWFESLPEEDGVTLLICVDGEPTGSIGFWVESDLWRNAEVGYSLAPEAWNNGYTTDALSELAAYAFEERGLHKLVGRAYETNPASQRVLEKVGFEREGVLREEAFVQGEFVDLYRYGLLAAEFDH